MRRSILPGILLAVLALVFIAGCEGRKAQTPDIPDMEERFGWWPTKAVPQPVDDPRSAYLGMWWWPTEPGVETSPIWGNRGYVYVLKWTKTEEEVPSELTVIDKGLKPVESLVLKEVHFAFDESTLTPAAQEILSEAAGIIKQYPNITLTIEGHTCSIGNEQYNMGLGQRRADSVMRFLVSQGVSPDILKTVSYGESRRKIEIERTPADYSMNRRVEFSVEMVE